MSGMKCLAEDLGHDATRAEARRALAEAAKDFGLDDLEDDRLDALAAELDALDLGDARLVSDPELMRRIGLADGDEWSLDDRIGLTDVEPTDDDFDDDEPEGRP